MVSLKSSSVLAVLLFVVSFANRANAQSLNILPTGTNRISLEATSPPNIGYRFQASTDLENWEDISDQASGPLSHWIDLTNNWQGFFRTSGASTEDAPVTLILLGDSTVADFVSNFYGWGQALYERLKPNVLLVNYATPLESTRSFLGSIRKDNLQRIKPDFVLVQLGLEDDNAYLALAYTSLPEYEENLRKIVQLIRDFKGTPILVTPPVSRWFWGGQIPPGVLADRSAVMRKVATELQVYFIDLNQLTFDLYNQLGQTDSAYITYSDLDRTHFSEAGSHVIADLVVKAFPAILKVQTKEP
jgi:lysophospholipase L1-like esterase